jgi:hypothetical protein
MFKNMLQKIPSKIPFNEKIKVLKKNPFVVKSFGTLGSFN